MEPKTLQLTWPVNLTLQDVLQLIRAKYTSRIPDRIAQLKARGVSVIPDQVYTLINEIEHASAVCGFFLLDPSPSPEKYDTNDLPRCMLMACVDEYIDYRKPQIILDLYDGTNIPDDVEGDARRKRIAQQRQRPVLVQPCRERGCTTLVQVDVEMVATAIRSHNLMLKNLDYTPPTFCRDHRNQRDHQMAEKRDQTGRATLGDVARMHAKNREKNKEYADKLRKKQPAAKEMNGDSNSTPSAGVVVVEPPVQQAE